jgi:hypothetical protein
LTDISLTEKSDRSGTIYFGLNATGTPEQNFPFTIRSQPLVPSFESIQNAKNVYEIIRNAQKGVS